MIETDTIILGAGLTGLTIAHSLKASGHAPIVLEKSRGTGGRLATKRVAGLTYDHGAPYVVAKSEKFRATLANLRDKNAAEVWSDADLKPAYVGAPGMSGLVKPLAAPLDIRTETEVASASWDFGWQLWDRLGQPLARCEHLIAAIPAPQASRLLAGHPLADTLDQVSFDPCWTLMVAFDRPAELPKLSRDTTGPLNWIALETAKPGRASHAERYVVQASGQWSLAYLEDDRTTIEDRMLGLLEDHAGKSLPDPFHVAAHRWRYSTASKPLGRPCLHDAATRLTIAGDWCLGSRAEHAWLSAQSALTQMGVAERALTNA